MPRGGSGGWRAQPTYRSSATTRPSTARAAELQDHRPRPRLRRPAPRPRRPRRGSRAPRWPIRPRPAAAAGRLRRRAARPPPGAAPPGRPPRRRSGRAPRPRAGPERAATISEQDHAGGQASAGIGHPMPAAAANTIPTRARSMPTRRWPASGSPSSRRMTPHSSNGRRPASAAARCRAPAAGRTGSAPRPPSASVAYRAKPSSSARRADQPHRADATDRELRGDRDGQPERRGQPADGRHRRHHHRR